MDTESVLDPPSSQMLPTPPTLTLRYISLPTPLPGPDPSTVHRVVSEGMTAPCRRCLHDARPGEEVDLIAYDPFPANSVTPYRGIGPIFVHTHECPLFEGDSIPETQLKRLMSLRGYDDKHMMVAADVTEGYQLEDVSKAMLADEEVRYIMVHNAKHGCFAFKIERA